MSAWARSAAAIGALCALAWSSACTMESHSGSDYVRFGAVPASSASASASPAGGDVDAGGADAVLPSVVVVDADRTLTAHAGDGVGVFTEYMSGGHWHVWWTCDTNVTRFDCAFDVTTSVDAGGITNAVGQSLATGDQLLRPSPNEVEATTQTSTTLQGLTFDAPAGAAVTVSAKLNGVTDGSILFFVQNGVVNGGYSGELADPLRFEPSRP